MTSKARADIKPGKEKLFQANRPEHVSQEEREFKEDAAQRKYSKEPTKR